MRNVKQEREKMIKIWTPGLIGEDHASFKDYTFQEIDFRAYEIDWSKHEISNTTFLGCSLREEDEVALIRRGAFIFKAPKQLPYNPFRKDLYNYQELMDGYSSEADNSRDLLIYEHFSETRNNPTISEALWQRIHDHAIDSALRKLIEIDERGMTSRKCVGIMGGHATKRTDEFYLKTAQTAKFLAENDYFVVSGGGPGIMEAANLGAYFAGKSDTDFMEAFGILQRAPHYTDEGYHRSAYEVLEQFPDGGESLAIPTWFYGHEPSNLFSTYVAKYFSNSIREDTLLAISLYGIVCAPGSAGTTQEIFMDATQNHYCTYDYYSPMIFLGKKRYEIDTLIYPLLRQLAYGQDYFDLLFCSDSPEAILQFLEAHPPRQAS
jgi:predicted Rossmann-fold nucleotide-binding protein